MSLESLGSIGEFIGGLAVIASFIYLAVQIRQNTRSVRAATHHSSATAVLDVQNLFAQDRDLAKIFLQGAEAFEQLPPEERLRFDALMRSVFVYYEDLYFQHEQGLIDSHLWHGRQRSMVDHLGRPGIVSWWRRVSHHFSDRFVSHIDDLLERASLDAKDER